MATLHKARMSLAALALAAASTNLAVADASAATSSRYPPIVHRGSNLPPPGQSQPVALVIALHPSGSSPQGFEQTTGFDHVADQYGFVVAYLSSQIPTRPAWTLSNMQANLSYISSQINSLTASQKIDPNRVFVTGFSAGATMAFWVGCNLSTQVAGIAPVSGWMRWQDQCPASRPVSMSLTMGTNDAQPINGTQTVMSAWAMAAKWRNLDGCTSQSSKTVSGPVTTTVWDHCIGSSGVSLNVIQGGTHQWPGPRAKGADAAFDASQAVWAFFAAHPRAPAPPTPAPTPPLARL